MTASFSWFAILSFSLAMVMLALAFFIAGVKQGRRDKHRAMRHALSTGYRLGLVATPETAGWINHDFSPYIDTINRILNETQSPLSEMQLTTRPDPENAAGAPCG